MKSFVLYFLSTLLSYIGGYLAYLLTLQLVWEQSIGGDWIFVLFFGAIAFFIVALPIYLLIISYIDKKFQKYKSLLYPLGCMIIFFIPTLMITVRFGSYNLFLPESVLFHVFFLTSGFIFGICHLGIKKLIY